MDTNNSSAVLENEKYIQKPKTIVFTDLVDSVKKKLKLRQVDALKMEQAHYEMLVEVINRFKPNGEMKQNEGDSYSFIFNETTDAIVFAFKAQEEQIKLRKKYPELHNFRVGIHNGGVFFVRNVVRGIPVDLTARIMSLADGDQILCSEMDHIDLIDIERKLNKKIIKKDYGFYKEKGTGKLIAISELGEEDKIFKKPVGNNKIWRADEWLGYDDTFQKELIIVFTNFEFSLKVKDDPNANKFYNKHREILLDAIKQFRESRMIHKGFDFHVFIFSQNIDAVKFAVSARKEHDKIRKETEYSKLPNFCVGIHTGSINVKRDNEQVEIWGVDVDLTKYIMETAKGGRIFCSEDVLGIIKNKIDYQKYKSFTQKELKRDILLYEVVNVNE